MLIPMLYAIPPEFSSINITMGYPLKNTPAATLFDAVGLMQKHIRWSSGTPLFYHTDVLAILNHHFVKKAVPHETKLVADNMIRFNKAYVSGAEFQCHPFLARLFTPVSSAQEAGTYLKDILDYLLGVDAGSQNGDGEEAPETPIAVTQIEREYLYHYRLAVIRLRDVIEALRQPLEDGSITVSRVSGSVTYPAKVLVVAACNPCPCGYAGDPEQKCICSAASLERYRRKLSGPIRSNATAASSRGRYSTE